MFIYLTITLSSTRTGIALRGALVLLAGVVLGAGLLAGAQMVQAQAILKNYPNRPVAAISHDLGIPSEQFVTCFNDVHPAAQGTHPTDAKVHANKAHLLNCLRGYNGAITNESLDKMMDRYRPGGHEAQVPEN